MLQLSSKIATIAIASAVGLGSTVSFAMPAPTGLDQASTDVRQVDWHGHGVYYHGGGCYHHHDNDWGPLAGFGIGALVGGLIASQPYYGNDYQGAITGDIPHTGITTGTTPLQDTMDITPIPGIIDIMDIIEPLTTDTATTRHRHYSHDHNGYRY